MIAEERSADISSAEATAEALSIFRMRHISDRRTAKKLDVHAAQEPTREQQRQARALARRQQRYASRGHF